jgi:beta-galactosidase
MVRVWALEAFAHGAEVVCFFRWRQAPFGQEQNHAGLLRPDGELSDGGREVAALAQELAALPGLSATPARHAIVFDYASQWAWEVQPQDVRFDYFRLVYDVYCGLRRAGLSVDILPPDTDDFGAYEHVYIPGLFAWTDALRKAMDGFAGEVCLGPRTGSRTEDFRIPDTLPPGLPGLKVTAVETLRGDTPISLPKGGAVQIWRERVEFDSDWDVVETDIDGRPVRLSRGALRYWAGWPDAEALDRWLGGKTGTERHRDTAGGRTAINYLGASFQVTP